MTSSTPKRRALGAALRKARQEKGWKLRAFAEKLGRSESVVSRWETGDRTPKPDQVAQMLTVLGINGDQYQAIIDLSYGADDPSWVATTLPAQRQQLAAVLDLEQNAKRIVAVSPLLIPGLLQTSAYIHAIMAGMPSGEFATRVAIRIGRRDVLTRAQPVHLLALVGEAALRQVIGDSNTTLEQLRYLLETANRSNITLRVLGYNSGWHPALEGPFDLIESASSVVVQIENRKSGLFLHEDADVKAYQRAAERVLEAAMSEEHSKNLIAEVIKEMESRA